MNTKSIARRWRTFAAGSLPIKDREIVARMTTIRAAYIWNVNPISSKPGPSSLKEADAADVLASNKDDQIQMKTKHLRPAHVQIQQIIESALPLCQESTLDRCIEDMEKTKAVGLLEITNHEVPKGEDAPLCQAV